jgi:hypothetical protein
MINISTVSKKSGAVQFDLPNAVKVLFWAVGGLPLFVLYFKRLVPHYLPSSKKRRARKRRRPPFGAPPNEEG